MTLTPLLTAPVAIQIHAFAALALIPLTIAQFALPRGTHLHLWIGWSWVGFMSLVALSSFWIQDIRLVGGFGPIHLLSIVTLGTLCLAIYAARRGQVSSHRQAMIWLTYGALVGAGVFTLLPGRLMNAVLLGL